jgi:hypothetical protein
VARLDEGAVATVPASPHAHVFVASGSGRLDDGADAWSLAQGDAARLAGGETPDFTASDGGAEVVIWTTA